MKNILLLLVYGFIISLVSCSDDEFKESVTADSGIIQCRISVPESFQTKGTPINSEQDPIFNTLGVLGYQTNGSFSAATNPTSAFFPNVQVTKSGTNSWQFDKKYYWPQSGYLSFFAYAPYTSPTNGITIVNQQTGVPTLTYTIPHNVADQPDLMVAAQQLDLFKTEVPLAFSHALACIGFEVNGENVPIDSIGIRGVYTTGTLSLSLNSSVPVWTNLTGLSDKFYKVGLVSDAEATNPSKPIMAANGYLMMIPQSLGDDAAIVVKFKGIDPKIIPLKNAGTALWKAGEKYIYSLKEGTYSFSVTATNNTVVYTGGEFNLNINSIYTKQNGDVVDMGWTAKIINPTTNDTTWINDMSELRNQLGGSNLSRKLTAGIAAFTSTSGLDTYLKSAVPVDSVNMVDLSLLEGYYSSANCYVVNGPGWFKFPSWVIGNGLLSATSSAYNTSSLNSFSYSNTAPYFVDYLGNEIKTNNDLLINTTGASTDLLWMDALNLITKVQLSADKNYIMFYVDPNTIRQGNGVIAIRDPSGRIMWSWHIWVNAWQLSNIDYKGYTFYFGNNIGVCYPATYTYPQRSMTIQFTQKQSNLTTNVVLTQSSETIDVYLNNPYYQWGRKDPMPGAYGTTAETKPLYGNHPLEIKSGPVPMSEAIQNPNVFYKSSGDWNTTQNLYLWGNPANPSYSKTIYDPSPISLLVPSSSMFSVLEANTWSDTYAGLGFIYRYPAGSSTIYFMGIGQRIGSTGLVNSNFYSQGFYWTNQSNNGQFYGMEVAKAGDFSQINLNNSAQGFSIMPVQNN
ncbi:MAG: hypothetical protein ACRDD8_04490, partial [Bacteroidales bacterium]